MRKLLLAVSLLFLFLLAACQTPENPQIKITTTLFPYYDIARALATDDMEVELILPPGTDPHQFDPSPFQLVRILESDLFIYNSDDFEYWVNNIKADLARQGVKSLEMANFVNPYVSDHHDHDHDHGDHDHHDHDHGDHDHHDSTSAFGDIETFEILNRSDNRNRVAYVHGAHWHGRLPNIEVGGRLSLGANIVSVGGRERELDSEGEVNGFDVRLAPGATEGIVELVYHGDHVHIRGVQAGSTMVQFIWTHRGEVRYISPQIRVVVGDDDDHGHDSTSAFGDIEVFEILNRSDNRSRVAYIHGDHWHGRLPNIEVGGRLSLGANITSVGGRERELDSEGEVNGFDVRLAPGATEGIVELVYHGDHVHIRGIQAGTTMVQFIWTHRGEVRYISPQIRVVVEEPHDHDHDDHDDHDGHNHGMFDPHIWTDPLNLIILTSVIRDALIEIAPESADQIRANAQSYIDELQNIHIAYSNWMTTRSTNVMMHGGHNAFAYFAARYNVSFVNAYRGFSTDAEPTPGALQTMIQTMNQNNVSHLFSEELISQNVANTISRETGATILYLYSMEKMTQEEYNDGITLFDMFRHNLEQLKIGMGPRG